MAEQKSTKKISLLATIVIAAVVGGASFYAGMQYQTSQRSNSEDAQFMVRSDRASGNKQGGMMQKKSLNRPVNGEIISQDDASVTIKIPDGSTKIVILSDKTTINKASAGAKTDLKIGEKVTIFGTENSDGSVTAQNVSIGGNMLRMMKPSGAPKK